MNTAFIINTLHRHKTCFKTMALAKSFYKRKMCKVSNDHSNEFYIDVEIKKGDARPAIVLKEYFWNRVKEVWKDQEFVWQWCESEPVPNLGWVGVMPFRWEGAQAVLYIPAFKTSVAL